MQYVLIALVVAALCVFGLGCRRSAPSNNNGGEPQEAVFVSTGKYLSRQDIQKQLAVIAAKPAPNKLAMGAMCYAIAPPPNRIDYVCPTCSERTLYALDESDGQATRLSQWNSIRDIQGLESLQRLARQITKLDVSLDQSQFCKHCSPEVTEPELGLIVRYPDRPEPHSVWGISWTDLTMIKAVTEGKLKYKAFNDGEGALKTHLKRLEELLGG